MAGFAGGGSSGGRRYNTVAEINVTSLVDIMMVLLIIFMLATPLMQAGVEVKLPKAKAAAIDDQQAITVSVTRDGLVYVNDQQVENDRIGEALTKLRSEGEERVFVKGDEDVPYGAVMVVIGEIKAAGIQNVGMLTEREGK
jgi:biopolymer transport protein ExbD